MADDFKKLKKGQRLSCVYWRDLVAEYTEGSCGSLDLVEVDASLPIADGLVEALDRALLANPVKRQIEPVLIYLQHAGQLNFRESLGLVKAVHAATVIGLKAQDSILLEFLRHAARLKMSFPQLFEVQALSRRRCDKGKCANAHAPADLNHKFARSRSFQCDCVRLSSA